MQLKKNHNGTKYYIGLTNNGLTERLLFLMKEKSMSGYLLSNEIGVSKSTISRIISKNARPSENVIRLISNYFGVSREWLLTGRGEMLREKVKKIYEAQDPLPTLVSEPLVSYGKDIRKTRQKYEEKIQSLKKILADKDKQIASLRSEMQTVIALKDQILVIKDELLKAKEEALKNKDELIATQKQYLKELIKK